MSARDVDTIREAVAKIRGNQASDATLLAVADYLDFIAPFAAQPNPYAPTVDHGLRIATTYLNQENS